MTPLLAAAAPTPPGAQTGAVFDGLKVDVGLSTSGSYTVTIVTTDWHRAGAHGYVFREAPLPPRPYAHYPDLQSVDQPSDMPFVDKSIIRQGGRWWSVYNYLR